MRGSDVIERVAKAIYEADDPWSAAFEWPAMGSKDQSPENYRRIARAALEVVRDIGDERGMINIYVLLEEALR